jgi:hypothetical protein
MQDECCVIYTGTSCHEILENSTHPYSYHVMLPNYRSMVMKFSHTSKAVNCRETKGLVCIANITANHGVSDLGGGGIWVRKAVKSVFRRLRHGCEFRKPSKRSQAIF